MNRQPRRERRRYDPVASREEPSQDEATEQPNDVSAAAPSRPRVSSRRQYSQVAAQDDSNTTETPVPVVVVDANTESGTDNKEDVEDDETLKKECINVTILDFAQKRFQVPVLPSWTIARFKEAGATVHKVSAARQRLIFRGKLLADEEKTLKDYNITEDGVIVHLFPKPRVVITNGNPSSNSQQSQNDSNNDASQSEDGARVPTIVMNSQEAERRTDILVLGSMEFMEAQNNVKLFSFMLLIISSIELLNLFAIAMGVPQDDEGLNGDEYAPSSPIGEDDMFFQVVTNHTYDYGDNTDPAASLYDHFGLAQYADTAVSLLGVYVAILGLKASTENTLRLAKAYMMGLIAAGFAWLLFNFLFTAAIERKVEERAEDLHKDDPDFIPETDYYHKSLQVMILPIMVWFMCWVRAWNFQRLIQDAEREASERIESQLSLNRIDDLPVASDEENPATNRSNTASTTVPVNSTSAVFI